MTNWELDQLRFAAEQQDTVEVASKDLLLLLDEIAARRAERN